MELNLKQYTAKLTDMPKLLNLTINGEKKHYILTEDILIDDDNKKCYVEYVGGKPHDKVLQ